MHCDDRQWDLERLAVVEDTIRKIEKAILELSTGAVLSYSLDTGQSRQSVTKQSLGQLNNLRANLLNERQSLRRRLGCGGSKQMAPGW